MADCPELVFDQVNDAVWTRLVQKAEALGAQIGGHSGDVTKSGFTVRWDYDPTLKVLRLHCTKKPFIVSRGLVTSKIEGLVKECMA